MVREQQIAQRPPVPTGTLRAAMEAQAVLEYLPMADRLDRRFACPGPRQADLVQVSRALARIPTTLHRHPAGHAPTATRHETRAG